MSHHHVRRRFKRPSRSSVVAALTAVALSSAGVATLSGSASAVTVSELDLAWTGAPPSVGNGEPLRGVAHVNLNDHLGGEGVESDHVVTFRAAGGMFTGLPSACRADGDPVSAVAPSGAEVRCNLGRVRYGTAMTIDFTVVAHSADGGTVGVTLTDGSTTATVPPVPVTAPPGVDVIFNEAQRVQANAAWQAIFPIAVALPKGAADLKGPISFDVVIANKTSTNAPAAVTPGHNRCVPLASVDKPSSMPATSPQAPVPTTCTLTQTSPGVLHVTLDGYRTPATTNAPTAAADGSSLPTDRHFFAAFGLPLQSTAGVHPATSAFHLTVMRVHATTSTGAAAPEVDATNNTEAVAITVPGGYAHNWAHPHASPAPMDTRVVGGGGPWAASYYAAPGDQIITNTTTGVWGGATAATATGSTWSVCQVLDGPAAFNGYVQPELQSSSAHATAPLPPGSHSWSVYRGPLPPSGSRDSFDCGSVHFTPVGSTVINSIGGECGCAQEEKLTVADPAAITAIRLTADPAAIAHASTLGVTPARIGMHASAQIASTASAANVVWTLGSVMDRSGTWHTASDHLSPIATTPGTGYPSTNALRDVMHLIGARPYVDKTVNQPDVRAGDVVTYSVRTGAEANLGSGSASWTVTDTIPNGVDYVDGSASQVPSSVARRTDGTTVLSWSMRGPVNTDTVITYRARIAFASGTRRNTAVASIATTSGGHNAQVETDEDSADVVYADDGRTLLVKSAGSATFAAGGSNTWRLSLSNLDTVDQAQTDIIDVLPWNGDPRGTAFHGTYVVDSVSSTAGDKVYYATDAPARINTDPNAVANGSFGAPSAMWSPTAPADRTLVTAIRVVGGKLPVGATKSATIAWHPLGGRKGDHFENIAWAKATHTRLQMIKAAATSTVSDGSKLQIAKVFTAADGWVEGDTLHYRVTVHNPSASSGRDVRVHDLGGNGNDPASVTFTGMSQGTFDEATRTWVIGDLAPGQTVTATLTAAITVGVDRTKPFENLAYVENPSNPYHPSPGSVCQRNNQDVLADTDQCDVASISPPRLRIDKRADAAAEDGTVTWTIHVRVDGTVGARDVRVEDTYPAGLDRRTLRVIRPPSQGSIDLAANRWMVGDLQPGAVASVTFQGRVKVAPGTRIINVASVGSPDVTPPAPTEGGPLCQANDGPTVDAALDADTDQCDTVETVLGPPTHVGPSPNPPGGDHLPETGGPSRWVALLCGTSTAAAMALSVTGRRRRPIRAIHRA